jgi:uncharacterized protein YciI
MKKRFAFFFFMKPEPRKIHATVPRHVAYWENRPGNGIQGGPFADYAGGLICFDADNIESAATIAMQDPFVLEDLLDDVWIKEWVVTSP